MMQSTIKEFENQINKEMKKIKEVKNILNNKDLTPEDLKEAQRLVDSIEPITIK